MSKICVFFLGTTGTAGYTEQQNFPVRNLRGKIRSDGGRTPGTLLLLYLEICETCHKRGKLTRRACPRLNYYYRYCDSLL